MRNKLKEALMILGLPILAIVLFVGLFVASVGIVELLHCTLGVCS